MATIYSSPDGIKIPRWEFKIGMTDNKADEQRYIDELKEFCVKRNPTQEHIGEIITFPVADGKACYMVAAVKPVQLIHMPIGDAWNFEYAHRLTKKDIVLKIEQQKSLDKLFGRKEK